MFTPRNRALSDTITQYPEKKHTGTNTGVSKMYCQSCGNQLSEGQSSCPSCGSNNTSPNPTGRPMQSHAPAAYAGSPPPTFLVPSILVTIFCCQIFGIVAIVYSAIAMGKNSSNDYAGAQEAASKAKMWCWLGFGVGLVIILLYTGVMVMGVLAGATATP